MKTARSAWQEHAALFDAAIPNPHRHELSAPELCDWVLTSLIELDVFPSSEVLQKRVPQVVVFAYQCAPRRASRAGLLAAVEFLFVFFLFNDDWAEASALHTAPASEAPAKVRYIRDWLARVEGDLGKRSGRFFQAFRAYYESLRIEAGYAARPGHPSFEEYVDRRSGRYQWVATAPYIELWEATEGLHLSSADRVTTDPLKELGVELTYLANDIGSVLRDSEHKNYVRFMQARESGSSIERAIELTEEVYRDKARAFAELAQRVELGSDCARYADLVASVTDGNLRATSLLSRAGSEGRYAPAVRASLESLPCLSLTTEQLVVPGVAPSRPGR